MVDSGTGAAVGGNQIEGAAPQACPEALGRRVLAEGTGVGVAVDAGRRGGHVTRRRRRGQTRVGTGDNGPGVVDVGRSFIPIAVARLRAAATGGREPAREGVAGAL